jgi:uncharacterized protein YfiM (DUF2279 family)
MLRTRGRDIIAPIREALARTALVVAVALLPSAALSATGLRLFPDSDPAPRVYAQPDAAGEAGLRLLDLEASYPWSGGSGPDLAAALELAPPLPGEAEEDPPAPTLVPAPSLTAGLFTTPTIIATAGTIMLGSIYGMSGPWKYGFQSFHFTDEKWFEPFTYAGGADKCSHFVVSSGLARFLYEVYVAQGHSEDQSFALAFASSIFIGFVVEITDGVTVYGFSVQDLSADILGTTAGLLINRNHLEDLLGIRLGKVSTDIPERYIIGREASLGSGYSNEIYTADLKFAGLADRLHYRPGLTRFLMLSVAYFTKGFGYEAPIPSRYQNFGFELGLNVPEILMAVGVKDTTWWGKGLLAVFNFFRIPFTQVGVYYDITNGKWYGPGAPYGYYPH